jgi:hypothetical protein
LKSFWNSYAVSASLNKYRHNRGEGAELIPLHWITGNSFWAAAPSSNTTDCRGFSSWAGHRLSTLADSPHLHLVLPSGSFPQLECVLWTNLYWSYVEFNTNFTGAHYQYLTPVSRRQDMPPKNTGLSPQFVWSALLQLVVFNPQLVPHSKHTAVLSTALSRNVPRKRILYAMNLPWSVCDKRKILYVKVCTCLDSRAITTFAVSMYCTESKTVCCCLCVCTDCLFSRKVWVYHMPRWTHWPQAFWYRQSQFVLK